MENSKDAYFEKILANAAHLVETENIDAANILKQCSLEIEIIERTDHPFGRDIWGVKITAPREAFKILSNEENCITNVVYDAFKIITDAEKVELKGIEVVPRLHDPDPDWRYKTVDISSSDEQLLASTIHYLLQGGEEDRYVAGLLKDCILTTEERLEDDRFRMEPSLVLEIELRCPRQTYHIFSDKECNYLSVVQSAVEVLVDKRYLDTLKVFITRAELVQIKPGWRDELIIEQAIKQEEVEVVPFLSFIDVLRSQQRDFIERLQTNPANLLQSNIMGFHSEVTLISSENPKRLRDFCWKMTDKFKRSSSPNQKLFIENLKGKLGEEAFSARIGSLVTEVDYEQRVGGDGKVDFRLKANPAVGIQVKARNGEADTIEWFISEEEVLENAIVVCFLIQEEVDEAQPEYRIITAGFLPTNLIKASDLPQRFNKTCISMENLLYGGGLRSYLEFLEIENQYLISKSKQEPQTESERQHLDKIWQQVLDLIQPPSTRMLMRQQGELLKLDDYGVRIFIQKGWSKTAQDRVALIEAAFEKVLQRKVKVEIVPSKESSENTSNLPTKQTIEFAEYKDIPF
ncbi:hypothetical protein H6F88_31595 [Oculatella sp. FACHB-28]|uniref:hypothetical protein n=1 Tax=Oculatella sp. FACHB-28 TaxID=2692845 RepID=UPI0016864B87|nr:hypothetical protein [Oculatella sp. FACHB-28]MBD2060488.1 hypothetical protein [Oculatella sp. FACHB-28]